MRLEQKDDTARFATSAMRTSEPICLDGGPRSFPKPRFAWLRKAVHHNPGPGTVQELADTDSVAEDSRGGPLRQTSQSLHHCLGTV